MLGYQGNFVRNEWVWLQVGADPPQHLTETI